MEHTLIELQERGHTPETIDFASVVDRRGSQDEEKSDEGIKEPLNASSLPPMDYGFHAWAYVCGAYVVELLTWSYPFSYGVFLEHYATHEFADVSTFNLSLVGSTSTGIMYCSAVFLVPLMNRYPWHKRKMIYTGLVLCIAGLVGAAFATKAWHLILTQGVIYGLGGSMLYFPVMTYLWEWFSEKKGFASGLMYSGTGVGGVVVPFAVQGLLNKFGHKVTLLATAASFLIILPALMFVKPRAPVSQIVQPRPLNTKFLHSMPFWILLTANSLQALGNFLPALYLPTFAADLNLGSGGTLALSLMNGASALGYIFFGYLGDRFNLRVSIILSAVGSALSVFCIWGFCSTLAPLCVFACLYGILGPSWAALWPCFVSKAIGGDDPTDASTLASIFVAGRGIGNVLSAPIASGLLHSWAGTGKVRFAYGVQGYGPMILFTGCALLSSTVGVLYPSFPSHSRRT